MINYDSPRGGVSVITEKGEVTTSYLLVQRAQRADSGQYTCHPSNANTKTILVHVLNGMYIHLQKNLEVPRFFGFFVKVARFSLLFGFVVL